MSQLVFISTSVWVIAIIVSNQVVQATYPYYGKLIQSGWSASSTHGLVGDIYAVDKDTFTVVGFSFDAIGDGAVFLLGTDKAYAAVAAGSGLDDTAVVISNPLGQLEPLRKYDSETVMLELPSGKKLTDYKYIAVGVESSKQLYGGAEIASDFIAPAPQTIGTFKTRAHSVASGEVTVLNDRMISIKAFRYDGQGPDAFFYVGITSKVEHQSSPYGVIPDENGISNEKARTYSDRDIVLTLPSTMSATDLKWLSMYCVSYAHNFGEVTFPATLNVPPSGIIDIDRTGMNCEKLNDDLQVAWLVSEDSIAIELAGNIDRDKDYMAFGLSGSDSDTSMINADVVVTDFRDGSEPRAIDYFLTSYAQCAGNGGACPDTSTFNSASDDVMMTTGQITNGIVRVKYHRGLTTDDVDSNNKDKVFKVDGTEQQIVWAIGPLNTKDEAAKHYAAKRTSTPTKFNFNRDVIDNCPSFVVTTKVEKPKFQPHHLYGKEGTVFTVEIGQAASEQGYKALTDLPSWGIAWYVNGILIPELHLKRGVSYTFRVGGGTDPSEGSKYHPLYFTDDVEGGYEQTRNGTIYPGKVDDKTENYAVGAYCEWKSTSKGIKDADAGYVYQCFEEFKDNLYLDCDDDPAGYTEYVFTPDAATPDLIYYQCYTHKSLGWKVHIYDELPADEIADVPCSTASPTLNKVSMLMLLFAAVLSRLM